MRDPQTIFDLAEEIAEHLHTVAGLEAALLQELDGILGERSLAAHRVGAILDASHRIRGLAAARAGELARSQCAPVQLN